MNINNTYRVVVYLADSKLTAEGVESIETPSCARVRRYMPGRPIATAPAWVEV
jgi:hypothetical protein